MKLLFLLLCGLFLASCSAPVIMTKPDGTKIVLGAGLLENSTSESANVKLADGTALSYTKAGKNQTSGVTQLAGYIGTAYAVGKAAETSIANTHSNNAAATAQAGIAAKTTTTTTAIKAGAPVAPVTVNAP
jgi:hypothetical protein